MPKGFSLHLGVNVVDRQHYGNLTELQAAVNDAQDYRALAAQFNYAQSVLLRNEEVTAQRVLSEIASMAQKLAPGDIFLLTYSGHGGQIDDPMFYRRDDQGPDETWCLFDRQLLDDELYEAFGAFARGVRILVISDSCHSGTMTRDSDGSIDFEQQLIEAALAAGFRTKDVPVRESGDIYQRNFEQVYRPLLERIKRSPERPVQAAVKLLAACLDHQKAFDGMLNGRFTGLMKRIIADGSYLQAGESGALLALLRRQFQYPTPNLFDYGSIMPAFDTHFPMLVDVPNATAITGYRTASADEGVSQRLPVVPVEPPTVSEPAPSVALRVSVELEEGTLSRSRFMDLLPDGVSAIHFVSEKTAQITFKPGTYNSAWEIVHLLLARAKANGLVISAEPAAQMAAPTVSPTVATRNASDSLEYMPQWPPITTGEPNVEFAWHLGPQHSELALARAHVLASMQAGKAKPVRIAHFDTGYFPTHPTVMGNKNILHHLAKSFVPGEQDNKAIDIFYGSGETQGHGLGTIGLLAGWEVGKEHTQGFQVGHIGGAPWAEVIPIRIADSVVILDTDTFCQAVDYAIEQGCEIITMSMGGKPSAKMAKAVNKAYEAGIIIVTAAGNCIVKGNSLVAKISPRTVVWPARFARVTAACGACHNQWPYDFELQEKALMRTSNLDMDDMQGNWGPAEAMQYAVAAYTPNTCWAAYRQPVLFRLSGGGTSSATPQVAATAALYLMEHRNELEAKGYYQPGQQWKKVEAVRRAIFKSAHLPADLPDAKRYYGHGIIRAMKALSEPVMDIREDMKAPEAESSWFGLTEALGLFINRRKAAATEFSTAQQSALAFELQHVLLNDPALTELADSISFEATISEEQMDKIVASVKESGIASAALKAAL
jgi:Subtilase family/Caspase domain